MAITTLANVKTVLQISSTLQDTLISAMIPLVEDDYMNIRNKPYDIATLLAVTSTAATADGDIYVTVDLFSREVEIASGDTKEIVAMKIAKNLHVPYYDMTLNGANVYFVHKYGKYETMTFDGGDTGVTATITENTKVYPAGSEITAIQMVKYQMDLRTGKTSESLGDYSVSFDVASGYPKSITGNIKKMVSFV